MRIVHIHETVVPGLGYQENCLPAKQRELGHDVHVVTSDRYPARFEESDTERFDPGTHRLDDVPVHRLESRVQVDAVGRVVLKGLEDLLDALDPDVVQSREVMNTQTLRAARYCKRHGVDLFVDEHTDTDNLDLDAVYKKAAFDLFNTLPIRYVVENANLFLPVQPYAKDFLVEDLGVPESKTEVLPLGVDTDLFAPDGDRRERKREELGVAPGEKLVVFAGHVEPSKDLDVLVRAFARLEPDHDVTLLLVGRPSEPDGAAYLDSLESAVDSAGVSDAVTFHDFVPHEDLPAFFDAADFGVWPGKLGVTMVEAVGTGLPSILPDDRSTNYMIANDNGLSFDRGSVPDLERKMERYLSDDDLLADHSERSVEHAERTLSWDNIARRNLELYEEYS